DSPGDAGGDVPDPHRAGGAEPARLRDHHRRAADLRRPGAAAGRDVVRGAGPAARGRGDRRGPGGGGGGAAAPLLPAHPRGLAAAGRRGGPVAGQRRRRAVPAEAGAGDGMSGPPALERGYRRLLAWYPRGFRREHEEELLAVLLAGARPGQRRPGLAEAVNLMISGLGARLRRPWGIRAALTCTAALGGPGDTPIATESHSAAPAP